MLMLLMVWCLTNACATFPDVARFTCSTLVFITHNAVLGTIWKQEWQQTDIKCSSKLGIQEKKRLASILLIISTEKMSGTVNSYSASHDNWCTATLWNRIMTAQCEGMGEGGSARYEPALLPPCPSIRALSYSNCQEIHSRQQTGLAV